MCALRVSFIVRFFTSLNPQRQQNPNTTSLPTLRANKRFTRPTFNSHHGAITHVFLTTDMGDAPSPPPSAPSKKNVSPLDTGEDKRASLGGGAPRRRHAPPPIAAGNHDTQKRLIQSRGELPESGSLHPARGRDKKDRELYPCCVVPWRSFLLLVCWALLVVGHRSWLAGSFVGSWLRSLVPPTSSSPTVVGCVGALELGIPVPVHGLR